MKALIARVRERTGTERSDADLAGLITKKAALLGVAVLSDRVQALKTRIEISARTSCSRT
jgi:hypothetical protein